MHALARLWVDEHGDPAPLLARAERIIAKRDSKTDHLWMVDRQEQTVAWARVSYFESMAIFPANCVPTGWYLMGVNVLPPHRRQGIATALCRRRLDWLSGRTDHVFTFIDAGNRASEDLHRQCGFRRVALDVWFPGLSDEVPVLHLWRAPTE